MQLPTKSSLFEGLGINMHSGLVLYGAELQIPILTSVFQSNLNAYTSTRNDFAQQRSAYDTVYGVFHTADQALTDWLLTTKGVLTGLYGYRYSLQWAQAGFVDNTTALPDLIQDRLSLAERLIAFFTAQPDKQVASMLVTAAQATALRTAFLSAQKDLLAAKKDLRDKKNSYGAAYATMAEMMRSVISFLTGALPKDDTRWLSFGLPMPGTKATPGKPQNVVVGLDAQGRLVIENDAVPLATRYRYRMLRVGLDTEYERIGSSTEPIIAVAVDSPGLTLQIIVQAVNGGLQGVPSEPVQFTMPTSAARKLATETTAPAAPSALEQIVIPANGETRNGNGSRLPALA